MPLGTAVVISASSSAKVTLKMPSVETTKTAVMPSEASSRESRVSHALEIVERERGDRERAIHVGEREDQVDDDRRDEEAGEQHERRSEEQGEVSALAAELRAREVGHRTSCVGPRKRGPRAFARAGRDPALSG